VEYKTSGWKLDESRRYITFSDGKNIGKLKLVGTRDLNFYQLDQIKRVRRELGAPMGTIANFVLLLMWWKR